MTLSLFISLENIWLPAVDEEDSDPQTLPTHESLGYCVETHSGSVNSGWCMMLYLSISLSGQVDVAFPRPHFQRQGREDHLVTVV